MSSTTFPVHRVTGDARDLCTQDFTVPDLVITDPPYPTLERHRSVGTKARLRDHTFATLTHEEILGVISVIADTMAPGSYLLAMVDIWSWMHMAMIDEIDTMRIVRSARAPVGALTNLQWRHPWTWVKTDIGIDHVVPGMGYHGRHATEMISIFQKRGKQRPEIKKQLCGHSNVVHAPRIKRKEAYPTQKPQALGTILLDTFSTPEDRILDPFAGSGRWLIDHCVRSERQLELWDVNPATEKIISSGDWP